MNEERESSRSELEGLPDDVGGLRLGMPATHLKQRTMAAVRAALSPRQPAVPRWRQWRLEASLTAAIVACVLLLPAIDRPPTELAPPPSPALDLSAIASLLESLGLPRLEPYIQVRLALARRQPDLRNPDHDYSSFRSLGIH